MALLDIGANPVSYIELLIIVFCSCKLLVRPDKACSNHEEDRCKQQAQVNMIDRMLQQIL